MATETLEQERARLSLEIEREQLLQDIAAEEAEPVDTVALPTRQGGLYGGDQAEIGSTPGSMRPLFDVGGMEVNSRELAKTGGALAAGLAGPVGLAAPAVINPAVDYLSNIADAYTQSSEQGTPFELGQAASDAVVPEQLLRSTGSGVLEAATGFGIGKGIGFGGQYVARELEKRALLSSGIDKVMAAIPQKGGDIVSGQTDEVIGKLGLSGYFDDLVGDDPARLLLGKIQTDLAPEGLPSQIRAAATRASEQIEPVRYKDLGSQLEGAVSSATTKSSGGGQFIPSVEETVIPKGYQEVLKIKDRAAAPYIKQLEPINNELARVNKEIKKLDGLLIVKDEATHAQKLNALKAEQANLVAQKAPLDDLADNPPITFSDVADITSQLQTAARDTFSKETQALTPEGRVLNQMADSAKGYRDKLVMKADPDVAKTYLDSNEKFHLIKGLSERVGSPVQQESTKNLSKVSKFKQVVRETSQGAGAGASIGFAAGNTGMGAAIGGAVGGANALLRGAARQRSANLIDAGKDFAKAATLDAYGQSDAFLSGAGAGFVGAAIGQVAGPQIVTMAKIKDANALNQEEGLDAIAGQILRQNDAIDGDQVRPEAMEGGLFQEAYSQAAEVLAPAMQAKEMGDERGYVNAMSAAAKAYPGAFDKPKSGIPGEIKYKGERILPMMEDRALYSATIAERKGLDTYQKAKIRSAVHQYGTVIDIPKPSMTTSGKKKTKPEIEADAD